MDSVHSHCSNDCKHSHTHSEKKTYQTPTESQKNELFSSIKVENDGENLSLKTISQILDVSLNFIVPQYAELTKQYRNGQYFFPQIHENTRKESKL